MSYIDLFYIINLLVVTPIAFANLQFYSSPKREKEYKNKVIKYKTLIKIEVLFTLIWICGKAKGVI
nr:MAG TPA: hypothetical protein [Caudoviricetes sp.]